MGSTCACSLKNDPGDNADFVWTLEWFPHALLHGLSLIHTKAIWTPDGIDLAGTTASMFLSLVVSPITWLWGPIVAYNVALIAAPVAGAWAARRLCVYITGSPWAGTIAGLAYGFSTFEVAQLEGHPQMVLIFCPPLAVLCVLKFLHGGMSRRRFVLQVAVILLIQVFCSVEQLFTLTVMGALALIFGWLYGDHVQRRKIVGSLPLIALSYAVMLVCASWYLYDLSQAPKYSTALNLNYPTDALAFVLPMPFTMVFGGVFTPITSLFAGGMIETDSYLGLPLILVVARFLSTRWKQRVTKLLATLMLLSVVWILGTHLFIAGRITFWLPFSLLEKLPGFSQVLQGRIALYLSLLVVIVLAIWVGRPGRHARWRWVCAVLAVICVLPNLIKPYPYNSGTWTNPTFFSTDMYKKYLRRGETILPITWGYRSESPAWQAEDHFYFNMAEGYWLIDPPPDWANTIGDDLWFDMHHKADASELRQLLVHRHVSDVIVQQNALSTWSSILSAAGLRPEAAVGGVTVYKVPTSWSQRARYRSPATPAA